MKSHSLQQELKHRFGVSARLEEDTGDDFTVNINGSTIYTHPAGASSPIDHLEIISTVGGYAKPLTENTTQPLLPEDEDDPDHIQWMNSFCSGE